MLKKLEILQKILFSFLFLASTQNSHAALKKNISMDRTHQKLAKEIQTVSGLSQIKEISLVEDSQRSLSRKMVLSFSKLNGFSYTSKKTKSGTIIHNLIFKGLDETDGNFGVIGQLLSQMTLKSSNIPAFNRFTLKPSVEKVHHSYVPQLEIFVEHDPNKVCLKVSQASGLESVEIEVFDCSRLKGVAYVNSSAVKYAGNSISSEQKILNFSGNYLLQS